MKFSAFILPALIACAPAPRTAWDHMSNTEKAAIVGAGVGVAAGGLTLLTHNPATAAAFGLSGNALVDGAVVATRITGTSALVGTMVDVSKTAKRVNQDSDNGQNSIGSSRNGGSERVMAGFQQLSGPGNQHF
jgi:hypothetical protein